MRRLVRSAGAWLLLAPALCASPAQAHPMNVAYADVTLSEREVEVALSVNLFELGLLLGLDRSRDGAVDEADLEAARPRIRQYLADRVAVSSRGDPLPLEAGPLRIARASDGRAVLAASLRFRSQRPLADVSIRCEPLVDLGPDHRTLARISRGTEVEQFVFQQGAPYRAAGAGPRGHAYEFLRLGVLHIFTGYDHILFLVGLLLVGASLVEVLKIVTSFTAAHSLTLSLAAFGGLSLPGRLVEAGIALSIAYVALENLLGRRLERRWLVSFGFGLVHGFGFASALTEMHLPRAGLATSLISFNAGVEVGQVAIVLSVIPLLRLLRRSPAYGTVTASASALILVTGLFWLYQRAL
jgi:hypothetical protein